MKNFDYVIIMKKMQKENLTANDNIRRKMMTFSFYELKSRNQALKRKREQKNKLTIKGFCLIISNTIP